MLFGFSHTILTHNSNRVKRTLPRLPSSFGASPQDDPRAHQGRVRSRPWVQGEWAVHVYLDGELWGECCKKKNDTSSFRLVVCA